MRGEKGVKWECYLSSHRMIYMIRDRAIYLIIILLTQEYNYMKWKTHLLLSTTLYNQIRLYKIAKNNAKCL